MNYGNQNVLTDTETPVLKPNSLFSTNPETGSKNVLTSVNPTIIFKDQIQRSTMTDKNIMLIDDKGQIVPSGIGSFNVTTAVIVPNEPLKPFTNYKIKFGPGFRALEGKRVSITDNTTTFQTGEK